MTTDVSQAPSIDYSKKSRKNKDNLVDSSPCQSIIKSGKNRNNVCGRKNCQFHKNKTIDKQVSVSKSEATTLVSEQKIEAESDIKAKTHIPEVVIKSQRKTKNLGLNTSNTQVESYTKIENKCPTAKCSDGKHEGERTLPVRKFYLNKAGKGLQGACITCQKNRRANRTKRARNTFQGKTKQEICDIYLKTYGRTKNCSNCKVSKPPSEFPTSIGMECGLHNHCITCSIGNSQGNGGLRDFIFMPDKDGIKYKKKDKCERCEGTHRLAVDHILPIAKGGTDCIPNKQTLCGSCNSKKSDTIDCAVTSEFLSARHKDESLDFTDNITLSRILSKKIYEFRQSHIDNSTLEEIRNSITTYAKKHNLGHNLDRIVEKIATLFGKK